MSKFQELRTAIDRIVSESGMETARLVEELKRLTPQELLRRGPETWEKVSFKAYCEVVKAVAPEVHIKVPPKEALLKKRRWKFKSWVRLPAWTRMLIMQLFTATASITVFQVVLPYGGSVFETLLLERSRDASLWPSCRRLSLYIDGCLYRPQGHLTLDEIARITGIAEDKLVEANGHILTKHIYPGMTVVIWRSRGKLIGSVP